jgi:hypothetical protein
VYVDPLDVTGSGFGAFTTLNFFGSFGPGSFQRVSGAGPNQPVLDGSVATRFGFAGQNTGSSSLTMFYDNFTLIITEPTPTPTITGTATNTPTITPTGTATATPDLTAAAAHVAPAIPTLGGGALFALALVLGLIAVWRLRAG